MSGQQLIFKTKQNDTNNPFDDLKPDIAIGYTAAVPFISARYVKTQM